jgi:transposase-like protein
MRRTSHATDLSSEEVVKDIRRATRKRYSAEEKIRIVLDGLRGEISIRAVPPRRHRRGALLQLVEGVPGGRQAATRRRYRPRRQSPSSTAKS